MKAKIFIGAKVSSKHGDGTITKIITKSSGDVEVTYANGSVRKEMAFNLTGENGQPLKKTPELNISSKVIDGRSFTASQIQAKVNGEDVGNMFYVMLTEGDPTDMVMSIISYAQKYHRISDKQAWALACYCKENNITLKF
jgi:hypothetical protein